MHHEIGHMIDSPLPFAPPPNIRPGDLGTYPQTLTSGGHHWSSQTCSLKDLTTPPPRTDVQWWPQSGQYACNSNGVLLLTAREGNAFTGVCRQLASWLLVHCSALLRRGRYASYWNAFLFNNKFTHALAFVFPDV